MKTALGIVFVFQGGVGVRVKATRHGMTLVKVDPVTVDILSHQPCVAVANVGSFCQICFHTLGFFFIIPASQSYKHNITIYMCVGFQSKASGVGRMKHQRLLCRAAIL